MTSRLLPLARAPRLATFILYLQSPTKGLATVFTHDKVGSCSGAEALAMPVLHPTPPCLPALRFASVEG